MRIKSIIFNNIAQIYNKFSLKTMYVCTYPHQLHSPNILKCDIYVSSKHTNNAY
jgi:hypothetical protein